MANEDTSDARTASTVAEETSVGPDALFGKSDMDDTDFLAEGTDSDEARERFGLKDTDDGEAAEDDAESDEDDQSEEEASEDEGDQPEVDDAALGKRVKELLTSDPVALARHILDGMTPEQKASLGVADATATVDLSEPLGLPDENDTEWRWEADVAARLNNMPRLVEQSATDVAARIAPYVDSAAASSAISLRLIRALADAIGLQLPEVDIAQVSKYAQAGDTWEKAVEKAAGKALAKAVDRAKRAKSSVERPGTVGNRGTGAPEVTPGDSMYEIARKLMRSL